tara:strand:- start:101 stop:607 length:507 start_codon:yes stop_codon:yes gene_type:complete
MDNSTKKHILEIIEKDNCPFTEYEVYGFFTGLVLSSYEKKIIEDKIIKFLDLSQKSLLIVDNLLENIRSKIQASSFEIYENKDNSNDEKASSLSEWTYYFLISFQGNYQQDNISPEIQEILAIYEEVSQIKQKYKLDEKENITKESLNDINSFLVKSTLYLFNKNNDK